MALNRRQPRKLPLVLLLACWCPLGLAACGETPQPDREPVLHLSRALTLASVEREAAVIDLGTAAAREHLGTGWSHDEQGPDGRPFVWGLGPASELTFHLAAARTVSATFEGRPFAFPDAPEQEVTVSVNGTHIGSVVMDGVGPATLELPGEALRAGPNRLRLTYRYHRAPRQVYPGSSEDRRSLGVAWYRIGLSGSAPRGEVRAAEDTLYLPWGTSVSYHVRLPAGSALRWQDLQARGEAGGELRIALTPEAGEPQELGRFTSPTGETLVPLPDELFAPTPGDGAAGELHGGERVLRLSLQALGNGRVPAGTGILLDGPTLLAPVDGEEAPSAWGPGNPGPRIAGTAPAEPAGTARTAGAPPRPLNVVVYMVDTLRADRLGCYGYGRATSPALDAFARGAVLFEQAVAQSPWTRPSVASLFTGVWPGTHGVHGRRDALAPEAVTLPEVLRDAGWQTAGFVTNGNVARAFGFAQGFEDFRLLSRTEVSSEAIHERTVEWLEARRSSGDARPFFLYLHTVDPHSPYAPEPEFRHRFAPEVPAGPIGMRWWLKRLKGGEIAVTPQLVGHLSDLYDAEVAQNDRAFGRLLELLDEEGLAGNTVVVFVSDHGEEFHEHGNWEHGKSLHTEVIDVPLVIRFPGGPGGLRVETPVQHSDLPPTLLAFLGLPGPPGMEGRDLTPLLRGHPSAGRATQGLAGDREAGDDDAGDTELAGTAEIFSHLALDRYRATSVTTDRWRLIDGHSRVHGLGTRLYDRRLDPGEHRDLSAERTVTAGYLDTLLRARELATEGALQAGEAQLDAELEAQLRALGYLP